MAAGALLNGARYTARDIASAAAMTAGVMLYSLSGSGSGGSAHGHGASSGSGGGGGLVTTAIGVGMVLVNLCLEGFTNAGQDALYRRGAVPSFLM